jgi:hypothetical protein
MSADLVNGTDVTPESLRDSILRHIRYTLARTSRQQRWRTATEFSRRLSAGFPPATNPKLSNQTGAIMQRFIATAVVCLAAAGFLHAQSARVSGQVIDTQQSAIKACEVVLRNTATQSEVRTITTESGSFLLPPVVAPHAPPTRSRLPASPPSVSPASLWNWANPKSSN